MNTRHLAAAIRSWQEIRDRFHELTMRGFDFSLTSYRFERIEPPDDGVAELPEGSLLPTNGRRSKSRAANAKQKTQAKAASGFRLTEAEIVDWMAADWSNRLAASGISSVNGPTLQPHLCGADEWPLDEGTGWLQWIGLEVDPAQAGFQQFVNEANCAGRSLVELPLPVRQALWKRHPQSRSGDPFLIWTNAAVLLACRNIPNSRLPGITVLRMPRPDDPYQLGLCHTVTLNHRRFEEGNPPGLFWFAQIESFVAGSTAVADWIIDELQARAMGEPDPRSTRSASDFPPSAGASVLQNTKPPTEPKRRGRQAKADDEKFARVIDLHGKGNGPKEIAIITGIPHKTVKCFLNRQRKRVARRSADK